MLSSFPAQEGLENTRAVRHPDHEKLSVHAVIHIKSRREIHGDFEGLEIQFLDQSVR